MLLLSTDTEALLLHVGDSPLLYHIERMSQGAQTIDRVGEIVTDSLISVCSY